MFRVHSKRRDFPQSWMLIADCGLVPISLLVITFSKSLCIIIFFQPGTIQIDNSGCRKSDGKSESYSPKLPQVIPFLVLFCFSEFSSCILPKISPHQVWNWVLEENWKQTALVLSSTVSQHGRQLEEKSEKAFSPAAPCMHQSNGGYITFPVNLIDEIRFYLQRAKQAQRAKSQWRRPQSVILTKVLASKGKQQKDSRTWFNLKVSPNLLSIGNNLIQRK